MTLALMKTKAEQQLAENFEKAAPSLPGAGWVPAARRAAFQTFASAGLPHRRIEDWKYTDLRARMTEAMAPVATTGRGIDAEALSKVLGPELLALDCVRIIFVDGRLAGVVPPVLRGCHAGSLAQALGESGHEWMPEHFGPNDANDPILALNAAFATDGALIRVEDSATIAKPVHLVFVSTLSTPAQVSTRNMVKVGANASVTIFESHVGVGDIPRQSNAVTQLHVGEGAKVAHIKHFGQGAEALHLAKWLITLDKASTYRGFQLTVGGALVRNETHADFTGPDAKFDLSGAFLGKGRDHIDTTLVINHSTPGCESRELFKGVLDGQARGVFQGKVIVQPDAQKTDGKQMAQVLMLSEDAEFDSKPELEIYADDVACGHGSTAAEIDGDMLFYLRSRGIPEDQARALLIESFVGEAIEKVEHEAIRSVLTNIALDWLRKLPVKRLPAKPTISKKG